MPTIQPMPRTTTSPFGDLTVIADTSASGVRGRIGELRTSLDATGLSHTVAVAGGTADVEAAARASFESGRRFVAAVGDDATVRAVVQAAFVDGRTIVEHPVIGVVPAGTGCELVRSFGLPDDVHRAVTHLTGEGTYPLDVMKVTAETDADRTTLYGHNMVEIGFRGAVASRTRGRGNDVGRARRFLAFWGTYAAWRSRDLTIHVDARTHELRAWDVIVANGQFADGGQRLSPRSYPGDGVLDALAFVGPRADAYRMLPRIFMNGGHLPDPGVKEMRAKIRLTVEGPVPLPVVLDGTPIGRTPVTIQVVPRQVLLKL